MLKTLMWILIGVILSVLGFYLMTIANRKEKGKIVNSKKTSFLLSLLDFLFQLVTAPFLGVTPGLGGFAAVIFIVGFFMALLNLLALVHLATISHVQWHFGSH